MSGQDEEAELARKWPVLGLLLAVLWLFVRGVRLPATNVLGEFLIGLAVGLPIAYGFRRFYSAKWAISTPSRAFVYGIRYIAVFQWELLTANIDVARRVLSPSMPIEPDVVEVPLRVETDVAITTIANSITLTPGTLTMDYNAQRNSLYVHSIAATDYDAIVDPIRTWEDYALLIFREERTPDDPVPDPPVPRRKRGATRDEAVIHPDDAATDDVEEAEPEREPEPASPADRDPEEAEANGGDAADDPGGESRGE